MYGKRIGRICLQNDQGYKSFRVLPVPGRRFCDMLGCVMCFHLYACLVKCEFCAVTYGITQRSIFYVSFAFYNMFDMDGSFVNVTMAYAVKSVLDEFQFKKGLVVGTENFDFDRSFF